MFLNIYSKGKYPADMLSNFAPHKFDFDGYMDIPCMEAFLQSLKFEDENEQKAVLYMNAKEGKTVGSTKKWSCYLYWKGKKIDRFSKEYMAFLEKAYFALLENKDFRQALADSKNKILLHTIGKTLRKNTVLTWWEFVGLLNKLRKNAL